MLAAWRMVWCWIWRRSGWFEVAFPHPAGSAPDAAVGSLWFELRRLQEHGHQHALQHVWERIDAGSPVAPLPLLWVLGLQHAPINALGTAYRDPHPKAHHMLAEPLGSFGYAPLLDPHRHWDRHRGSPDRHPGPVVVT
jgi:hypothetical protein